MALGCDSSEKNRKRYPVQFLRDRVGLLDITARVLLRHKACMRQTPPAPASGAGGKGGWGRAGRERKTPRGEELWTPAARPVSGGKGGPSLFPARPQPEKGQQCQRRRAGKKGGPPFRPNNGSRVVPPGGWPASWKSKYRWIARNTSATLDANHVRMQKRRLLSLFHHEKRSLPATPGAGLLVCESSLNRRETLGRSCSIEEDDKVPVDVARLFHLR
jgi:hypothetical protein